jgi:catechol 2,3-dioxygenase-like lactoylglutathione lyase family enzyme
MDTQAKAAPEWARRFFAVTLFVDDLVRERRWYGDVFDMPVVDESPENCVFRFPSDVFINLNALAALPTHVGPEPAAKIGSPSRVMLSLEVDDVDVVVERLAGIGVRPLVGPIDRPWGSRTATIADPSGNYWELFS